MKSITYRSLVARLAQAWTRRDIKLPVHLTSKYQIDPGIANFVDTLRILIYIYETRDTVRLTYKRRVDTPTLVGFTDSNWAEDVNNSRSQSGGVIQWGENTLLILALQQALIARSTCEAEWIAAHSVAACLS